MCETIFFQQAQVQLVNFGPHEFFCNCSVHEKTSALPFNRCVTPVKLSTLLIIPSPFPWTVGRDIENLINSFTHVNSLMTTHSATLRESNKVPPALHPRLEFLHVCGVWCCDGCSESGILGQKCLKREKNAKTKI